MEKKTQLLKWYRENRRDLPWRRRSDAYSIWISETMLQQTTSTAVIPFYQRFLARFPTVASLAEARIEDVYEQWAGLGYYSRARNLHRAAQSLKLNFPTTYQELLELPGLGPYTARAVASLAFGQAVGVLDGNVIRILSRIHDLRVEWWKPKVRQELQALANSWVEGVPSQEMNQAMMELGATICLPRNPACLLCPVMKSCLSSKNDTVSERPLQKPRRAREVWTWRAEVYENRGRILICRNRETPFLKKHWSLPGPARRRQRRPANFDFRHSITHHDIFVTVVPSHSSLKSPLPLDSKWVRRSELSRHVPASLVQKALQCLTSSGSHKLHSRKLPNNKDR